jgi:hypothetical protein
MSVEDIVARGVAKLDELRPGWHNKVDLAKLDLSNCSLCVLGQVFGEDAERMLLTDEAQALQAAGQAVPATCKQGFSYGVALLQGSEETAVDMVLDYDPWAHGVDEVDYGFNEGYDAEYVSSWGEDDYITYDQLDEEWSRVIRERQEDACQS